MRSYSFLILSFTIPGYGQPPVFPPGLYHDTAHVPAVLTRQYVILGDRLQKPGKERITLNGILTDSTSSSPVEILLELGGKLRITWTGKPGQKIIFNGTRSTVVGSIPISDDLVEAFVDDMPETIMESVSNGMGVRLLGQRFGDVSGAFCDYYDVPSFGQAIKKRTPVTKRYCFDSKTSLLRFVHYLNPQNESITTDFGVWVVSSGQAVPGSVSRMRSGVQVFRLSVQSAGISPGLSDGAFAP